MNESIDQNALGALGTLIDCLRETPPMDEHTVKEKRETHYEKVVTAMVDKGQSWGQAAGGALSFLTRPDAVEYIRAIDNDLGRQVSIVSNSFVEYLENGEVPAPHYAWRIAVILRKNKLPALELAFLQGWCLHFGEGGIGQTYIKLTERLHKIESAIRKP